MVYKKLCLALGASLALSVPLMQAFDPYQLWQQVDTADRVKAAAILTLVPLAMWGLLRHQRSAQLNELRTRFTGVQQYFDNFYPGTNPAGVVQIALQQLNSIEKDYYAHMFTDKALEADMAQLRRTLEKFKTGP